MCVCVCRSVDTHTHTHTHMEMKPVFDSCSLEGFHSLVVSLDCRGRPHVGRSAARRHPTFTTAWLCYSERESRPVRARAQLVSPGAQGESTWTSRRKHTLARTRHATEKRRRRRRTKKESVCVCTCVCIPMTASYSHPPAPALRPAFFFLRLFFPHEEIK